MTGANQIASKGRTTKVTAVTILSNGRLEARVGIFEFILTYLTLPLRPITLSLGKRAITLNLFPRTLRLRLRAITKNLFSSED